MKLTPLTQRGLAVCAREIRVMLPRQRLSHDCTELNITTLLTHTAPAPARSSSVAGSRSEECPHLKIISTHITPHLDIEWNNLCVLCLE